MSKKPSCYNQCVKLLQELHRDYPNYTIGMHIATATADYGDLWGIPDKELYFALEKYKSELELNIVPEKEIEKIIEEGKNLEKMFKLEDDYDDEDIRYV